MSAPGYSTVQQDGADTVFGGHIALNDIGRALLRQALPPVGHVRAAATEVPLRGRLDQLLDEVSGHRVGSAFAIRQHGQLFLLDMLRVYLDQAEPPPGLLRLLTDERLLPAVTLMHTRPGSPGAGDAGAGRGDVAHRLRHALPRRRGHAPLTYLSRWRMLLARRALRDGDDRVGLLASNLGYASESAFCNAFKREVGCRRCATATAPTRTGRRCDEPSGVSRRRRPSARPRRPVRRPAGPRPARAASGRVAPPEARYSTTACWKATRSRGGIASEASRHSGPWDRSAVASRSAAGPTGAPGPTPAHAGSPGTTAPRPPGSLRPRP
ncbi:helix-turn-helix domain-containing protein [Streptomyces sp. M19]